MNERVRERERKRDEYMWWYTDQSFVSDDAGCGSKLTNIHKH